MTRLTKACSRKIEDQAEPSRCTSWTTAGAPTKMPPVTRAMEAGVANHVWNVKETAGVLA